MAMRPARSTAVTPLARAVDLDRLWNATDADVADRLHPTYREALSRLPDGSVSFRGLPFSLGSRSAGRRWLLLDDDVSIDLAADHRQASHVVVAHFCDSARNGEGERPAGMPVGWVLPTGEPLATYELRFVDGTSRAITIRRRFEIADGIIGWGFLPFEAVGHRAEAPLDWRGPYPRQSPGRYAAAGHAGALGMLPASWGPAQTAVTDFVPTLDDDITYWLHAIPIAPTETLTSLRLAPLADPGAGGTVVVAGVTTFRGTVNPLVAEPRRQILIDPGDGRPHPDPGTDLGVVIRSLPTVRPASADGAADRGVTGWGRTRTDLGPPAGAAIVDLAAAPDARFRLGNDDVPVSDLVVGRDIQLAGTTIRALPARDRRVRVEIRSEDGPTPARVRFVSGDGRYLPPLGHRDEVNPALMEETGADVLLGSDAYAYVAGAFDIDLPPTPIEIEVVKGFEHAPIRLFLERPPADGRLAIDLPRSIELGGSGWLTADPHVHYVAPSTALLQAAAEDVAFVHLLATQAGDLITNGGDLAWGSMVEPGGRHQVVVGTENRQNLLGHLTLLGAREPVLPMAAGGAPEGRLGGAVTELLSDWADRCHSAGGLVVGAHFPLPYAEIAAAIVNGRIDAVEMQTFSPRLDTPSIGEWYRFLNCGYRLPVLGGTDKMSAEVPLGAIRTYARLESDAAPTFDGWSAAVRAGRTFATSGPIIELAVDGHEPGDVIELPAAGGRLEVRARARAAQPMISALELVLDGELVAREVGPTASTELTLATTIEVRAGAWIAARCLSDHEIHSAFATAMAAHTSPVYVEVPDRPRRSASDAEAIAQIIDGSARWLETMAAIADPRLRDRMVRQIAAAGAELRARNLTGG
jgi:hypothetical protein